ncbi:MAG: prolipoprotein diacylglyceryl transferase [Myxococcales bacterium]|nr:prolipoprotein diacylglyceryl transferase [Myxococcales bacterium]
MIGPLSGALFGGVTWDLDPLLVQLGPLQIRYYGVMFALTIYTGFFVWRRQALRNGESHVFAEDFLWWGVIAIVGGARLGHCLFYEPETYLKNPIEIVKFWKGGLASHGAALGLVLALWLFSRKYKVTWFRVADYLAPAIAIAAGGVRIGNFFNSEIVGRVTDVPWGVQFLRYCRIEHVPVAQCLPRHPSQFYEFLMGVATYLLLTVLEKRDIRRAGSGFFAGVFLVTYFSFRFSVEFFKEFQTEQLREGGPLHAIEEAVGFHFTMGQWLSVGFVVAGLVLLARALRQAREAFPVPTPTPEIAPEPPKGPGAKSTAAKRTGKRK